MSIPSSLTRANLEKFTFRDPSSPTSLELPADNLAHAKQKVYDILWSLDRIGQEGQRILENEELYIAGPHDIRYRGTRCPPPDLDDYTWWNATSRCFEERYTSIIKLESVKGWVSATMRSLQRLGVEGNRALEGDELYITGGNKVCYRGPKDTTPDLEDPVYWEARLKYFKSIYQDLLTGKHKRPPSISTFVSSGSEVHGQGLEDAAREEQSVGWHTRRKNIEDWTLAQSTLTVPNQPLRSDGGEQEEGNPRSARNEPATALPSAIISPERIDSDWETSKPGKRKRYQSGEIPAHNNGVESAKRPKYTSLGGPSFHAEERATNEEPRLMRAHQACDETDDGQGTALRRRGNRDTVSRVEPCRRSARIALLPRRNYRI